jgi:ATP-binding cassette, subfamily C (CFTR/MRP), member 1
LPLGLLYFWIQDYFIRTSRALNQLDNKSSGLAYTHLQSVYSGISTIRAFGHLRRFQSEMEQQIDAHQRASFAAGSVDFWLSVRLELVGAAITAAVSSLAVMAADSRTNVSAGMIGVALVNAQRITSILSLQVRSAVFLEGHLVSLRRVVEYTELPCEGGGTPSRDLPLTWPKMGKMRFRNYTTRYRPELNEVLRNLNLTIEGGQKIGVVGRTGAGKSSLTLALYVLLSAGS